MKLRSTLLVAVGLFVLSPTPQAQQTKTISNGSVTLSYKVDLQYGINLTFIGDALDTHAYALSNPNLWSIEFRLPPGNTNQAAEVVTPSVCHFGMSHSKTASSFLATWSNCTHKTIPGLPVFDVTVSAVTKPGDKVVEFTMSVNIDSPGSPARSLYGINFPQVRFSERNSALAPDGTPLNKAELAWPFAGGRLVLDPIHNEFVFPSAAPPSVAFSPFRNMAMQFLSYYERSETNPANLFLGTRDLEGHFKTFNLGPSSPNLAGSEYFDISLTVSPVGNLNAITVPNPDPAPSAPEYSMTYPFVLGVLRGDWYDASKFYRAWVTNPVNAVPWAAQGPMHSDGSFSSYLKGAQAFGNSNPHTALAPRAISAARQWTTAIGSRTEKATSARICWSRSRCSSSTRSS
jgi:hypothetical protein